MYLVRQFHFQVFEEFWLYDLLVNVLLQMVLVKPICVVNYIVTFALLSIYESQWF